jgi:hypothetical protein
MQLTDKITLDNNISVLNVEILHTSNGIAPSTHVEPVSKQHLDTHHEHVMDESSMMESGDIMMLKVLKMEILPENVNLHLLFVLIYFPNHSKVEQFFIFLSSPHFIKRTIHNVSLSCFPF